MITKFIYKKYIISALFTIIIFLYIYPVTLVTSGFPLYFVSYAFLLLLWGIKPFRVSLNSFTHSGMLWLFFLAAYAAILTLLRNVEDFSFAIQIAKLAMVYIPTGIILGLFFKAHNPIDFFNRFLNLMLFCIAIQATFIFASVVSIGFRTTLDTIIIATGNTNYLESFRVRGFSSAGGASLSLIQAVGVGVALYFYKTNKKIIYLIIAIYCCLSTFAVGRSGFFISILYFPYFLIGINNKAKNNAKGSGRYQYISLLILVPAIILFMSFFDSDGIERTLSHTIPWVFEFFINAESGNYSTGTTNSLFEMINIPSNISDLIFGIGAYDQGAFGYKKSDSGYIKTLYASGLIGVLIFYIFILFNFRKIILIINAKITKKLLISFLIIGLIMEIKEPFLYQNYFSKFIFILFGFGSILNKKIRCFKNEKNKF